MLWEWVKAERRRHNWTQEILADRAGLAVRVIRAGEQGQRPTPSLDTLDKLARAFDVPLALLLQEAGVPGEPTTPGTPEAYVAALAALGVPPAVLAELIQHAAYIEPQDWEDFVALAARRAEKKRAAQDRQPSRRHPLTEQQGEVPPAGAPPDPPHPPPRLATAPTNNC